VGIQIQKLKPKVNRMSKTKHKWIPWCDECPNCGNGDNKVYTLADDGAYDGDAVRCVGCGLTGYVSADDDECMTVWTGPAD